MLIIILFMVVGITADIVANSIVIEFCSILLLADLMNSCLQVPFYIAELTEKIAQSDRILILKAALAKLKVCALNYLENSLTLS